MCRSQNAGDLICGCGRRGRAAARRLPLMSMRGRPAPTSMNKPMRMPATPTRTTPSRRCWRLRRRATPRRARPNRSVLFASGLASRCLALVPLKNPHNAQALRGETWECGVHIGFVCFPQPVLIKRMAVVCRAAAIGGLVAAAGQPSARHTPGARLGACPGRHILAVRRPAPAQRERGISDEDR